MSQMSRQDKTPENLNELEIGNFTEKEFRITIVKMIQDLRKNNGEDSRNISWSPQITEEQIEMTTTLQFSCSVMSNSLRPHESQHSRPPCPSTTPGVHSNSRPSSQWCHPAISSSVVPFVSCPQSLPASGFFQMSQIFTSGGQSIGVSASASFLPMNTQDRSPLGWTDWLDLLAVQGILKVFSNTTVQKHQFFSAELSSHPNSHIHTWPLEKP